MKVFQVVGFAAFSLFCASGILAQNSVSPGTLATPSNTPLRSPFLDPPVDSLPLVPKHNFAQVEDKHDKRVRAIWIASMLAMAGGTTADAATSWHRHESNGLLASSDGTFGAKGAAIKAGIAAGMLTPQIIFRKRRDWRSAFAVGNFAEAGIFAGATVHNLNTK